MPDVDTDMLMVNAYTGVKIGLEDDHAQGKINDRTWEDIFVPLLEEVDAAVVNWKAVRVTGDADEQTLAYDAFTGAFNRLQSEMATHLVGALQ